MVSVGIPPWRKFQQLKRDIQVLLLCSFFIPFGSFIVLPFVAIFMSNLGHFPIAVVGVVLAAMSIIQYCGGLVGGLVANAFGFKRTMVLGLSIRSLGFIALACSVWSASWMIPAVLLIATGAALYLPANKSYIVTNTPPEEKAVFLSLSNAALNAGMGLGPLIGGIGMIVLPYGMFAIVALMFVVITYLHLTQLKSNSASTPSQPIASTLSRQYLIQAWVPLLLNTGCVYIYFFFQNYLGPYVVTHYSTVFYSVLLLTNALIVIIFQPMLAKRIDTLSFRAACLIGIICLGLGMLLFSQLHPIPLIAATVLVSLSELILFLKMDLKILAVLKDHPAIAFGLQRFSAGIGASLCGLIGGAMYGHIEAAHMSLSIFWLSVGAQAALLLLMGLFLAKDTCKRV